MTKRFALNKFYSHLFIMTKNNILKGFKYKQLISLFWNFLDGLRKT